METDNIRLKTFLIIIVTVVFIEGGAIFFSRYIHLNPMLITCIIRLLEIITIIKVVITWEDGLTSIGLDSYTIIPGIEKGMLWAGCFGLGAGFVFFILHFSGINPLRLIYTQLPTGKNELALFLFVGCIIGPVAEELFFRGILYGFFRRWGISAALIFSTVIFIIAHHNTGTVPLTQVAGGIIFAIAYEIEKNLIVPIIIHILGNTAIFALSLVL